MENLSTFTTPLIFKMLMNSVSNIKAKFWNQILYTQIKETKEFRVVCFF